LTMATATPTQPGSTRELWMARVKRLLGPRWTVKMRCLTRGLGLPRWGNLRRVEPFSDNFGFDRGTAVDRYYLERFLDRHRDLITGRVLEIQSSGYTSRYGHNLVESHTVDIVPDFGTTYVCDLAESRDVIPSNYYDCFLLPNTLSVLQDIDVCLREALRVVKPGGAILGSAAGLVPLTPDAADYWHLSAAGWREITAHAWADCEVDIESHGNCLVATAAIMGLAYQEFDSEELDFHDSRYPVLVTLLCRKP